jgi:hypothetical protein
MPRFSDTVLSVIDAAHAAYRRQAVRVGARPFSATSLSRGGIAPPQPSSAATALRHFLESLSDLELRSILVLYDWDRASMGAEQIAAGEFADRYRRFLEAFPQRMDVVERLASKPNLARNLVSAMQRAAVSGINVDHLPNTVGVGA